MAFEIHTEISIQASPEKVWNILTDFPRIHTWNPFIKSIAGDVAEGKQIKVALGGMKFTPIVLDYKPAKEFRWLGQVLFKGLFDGAHRFHLEGLADGTTLFRHSEKFTGMLVPVFKKKLLEETKANFEAFNQGLKKEAEKV